MVLAVPDHLDLWALFTSQTQQHLSAWYWRSWVWNVFVSSLEGRFEDEELQQILDDIQTKRSFQYWIQIQEQDGSLGSGSPGGPESLYCSDQDQVPVWFTVLLYTQDHWTELNWTELSCCVVVVKLMVLIITEMLSVHCAAHHSLYCHNKLWLVFFLHNRLSAFVELICEYVWSLEIQWGQHIHICSLETQ